MSALENIHVRRQQVLLSPAQLHAQLPLSGAGSHTVQQARRTIDNIFNGRDHRLLVIVGPCSIHDLSMAEEYASRLQQWSQRNAEHLFVVMRVYFEKPRTALGWKGFLNDPRLDGSFRLDEGLYKARRFLIALAEQGMAAGTEALDPISPQYLGDLFAWSAIGARTAESQTHREMASGLSTPVGFKNGTDGSPNAAIHGICSAMRPHHFLGINKDGLVSVIETHGNPCVHLIMRGGGGKPNYDAAAIQQAEQLLQQSGLPLRIVVDCSHANADKKAERQPLVVADICQQIAAGNGSIQGVMLESYLHHGCQDFPPPAGASLRPGVSITDPCMGWQDTVDVLQRLADLGPLLRQRVKA